MEFLVQGTITPYEGMSHREFLAQLEAEAQACQGYLASGELARLWRPWGQYDGRHGHMALWDVDMRPMLGILYVQRAYETFPLVKQGILVLDSIQPLEVNPNDPAQPASQRPDLRMDYATLRALLDEHHAHGEAQGLELCPGVSIHDHPGTDRSLQIHFMVSGQKIAEIGPPAGDSGESVVGGYIDFLAEWMGRPVLHEQWKQRIMRDNGLVHESYEQAVSQPRTRGYGTFGQDSREQLEAGLSAAMVALDADSIDAVDNALYGLARTVAYILGVPFSPRI
jgi:muconolactone delta-isomerase